MAYTRILGYDQKVRLMEQCDLIGNLMKQAPYITNLISDLALPESEWVKELRLIKDNFDSEGAEKPNEKVIQRIEKIIQLLEINKISILDVDPDVMGGAAIIIGTDDEPEHIWISCMNSGDNSINPTIDNSYHSFNDLSLLAQIKPYLTS